MAIIITMIMAIIMAIIMTMIMTMIKKRVFNNLLKKVIGESKDLLEKNLENGKDKKYTSADEILKRLNAKAEDDRKTNEILKKKLRRRSTKCV